MTEINLLSIKDRLDEIEKQMVDYSIGLTNVYNEFQKYSLSDIGNRIEELLTKIKHYELQKSVDSFDLDINPFPMKRRNYTGFARRSDKKRMTKDEIKAEVKKYLYQHAAIIEDENKSYWYAYQIVIEVLMELLYAGFPEKKIRIEIVKDTMESLVRQIEDVEIDE